MVIWWAIELNTRREIPYLRTPIYYFLFNQSSTSQDFFGMKSAFGSWVLNYIFVHWSRNSQLNRSRAPTVVKVQIGNNQSRSPLWNIILFSCSVYLHLFEIAMYLWLGSNRDETEFQFAFRIKITWNYIFEATVIWCRHENVLSLSTGNRCRLISTTSSIVFITARIDSIFISSTAVHTNDFHMFTARWRCFAKETTGSMAPMHFIFA